jgi:hypothetical protein
MCQYSSFHTYVDCHVTKSKVQAVAVTAGEDAFRTTVIRVCRSSQEFEIALYKPARVCEGLFADLRSAIEVVLNRSSEPKPYALENAARMNYINRIYINNKFTTAA